MNVLAFDTCFDACSVAAGRGLRSLTPSIAFAFEPMEKRHVERLMPMIESVMAEAGLAFADLDRIAVTIGPGTFTGSRISVAAARALALATGAPVVAYTSLELMAMSARIPAGSSRRIAIATDARRGEVYFQAFDRHTLEPSAAPTAVEIARAHEALGSDHIVVAGSGAALLEAEVNAAGGAVKAIAPDLLPDAFDMLFAASERRPTTDVVPLYIRAPDAKPPAVHPLTGARA